MSLQEISDEQESDAINNIAKEINKRLKGLHNTSRALQRQKLRNTRLVKHLKKAQKLINSALEQNTISCDVCGFEATGKQGLAIHKARNHK